MASNMDLNAMETDLSVAAKDDATDMEIAAIEKALVDNDDVVDDAQNSSDFEHLLCLTCKKEFLVSDVEADVLLSLCHVCKREVGSSSLVPSNQMVEIADDISNDDLDNKPVLIDANQDEEDQSEEEVRAYSISKSLA